MKKSIKDNKPSNLSDAQFSPFSQLDGNDEFPPEFSGLAGIASDDIVIPFIINLFRGMEDNWNYFEENTNIR